MAAWRSIGFAVRAESVGRADPERYQTALHHLDENLGAIELELTKGDLSQIAVLPGWRLTETSRIHFELKHRDGERT